MKWTRELLREKTKGQFFSICYQKVDGSIRTISCRLGVTKYLKKDAIFRTPREDVITVYDMVKKNYRSLRVERIQSIKVSGETYV